MGLDILAIELYLVADIHHTENVMQTVIVPCQVPLLTRSHRPRLTLVRNGQCLGRGEQVVVEEVPENLWYDGKMLSATPVHCRGKDYYVLTKDLQVALNS